MKTFQSAGLRANSVAVSKDHLSLFFKRQNLQGALERMSDLLLAKTTYHQLIWEILKHMITKKRLHKKT